MRGLDGASSWRIPPAGRAPAGATLLSLLAHLGAGLVLILAMTPQGDRLNGGSSSMPGPVPLEIAFLAAEGGAGPEDSLPDEPAAELGPALAEPAPPIPAPGSAPLPPLAAPPPPVPAPPSVAPLPRMPDATLALTMPPLPIEALPAPPLPAAPPMPLQPAAAPPPELAEAPPPKPELAPQPPRTASVSRPSQASPRPARRTGPPNPGPPNPGVPGEATPTAAPGPPGVPLAFSPPLITAARFRRPPRPPDYPSRAIELDLNGTVLIRALLDPEGDPREVRVHRSSGHAVLDHAAVAAVSRWAFEPASRDGQRIPAWVEVPVHFRLH
jgi:protein TonB